MKTKFEINGKDHKRAYRRHCARKKLKLRAKKWWPLLSLPTIGEHESGFTKKWADIWSKVECGEYARWLRTTGKPCSCEMCSPPFKREPKDKVQKEIFKAVFEINETEGLTLDD